MELKELFELRRSIRSFDESKKVNESDLREIVDSVTLAPTWKNSQTGRYYVISSEEMLKKVRESLPEFNQNSSSGASLIVTTFVKNRSGFNRDAQPDTELGNEWGAYDLGLQNGYLILKARELGLDTLIMGIRDAAVIREVLDIPETEIIVAVLAVGYRKADPAMRPRKAVDDIAKFL